MIQVMPDGQYAGHVWPAADRWEVDDHGRLDLFRRHNLLMTYQSGEWAWVQDVSKMRGTTTICTDDTLKMVREALSYAMTEKQTWSTDQGKKYSAILQRLVADIERQRPTGSDGKHGDLHTPECQCDVAPLGEIAQNTRHGQKPS